VTALKDAASGNSSWLVEPADGAPPVVLRRYDERATFAGVAYEHRILGHLAAEGWVVPDPVGPVVEFGGRLYCVTRFVPGRAVEGGGGGARRRRGIDLARLDLALRPLSEALGQRPGWRPQHTAVSVDADIDWDDCVERLGAIDARLADWAASAADATSAALADLGADALPLTTVHGDFAEWNVHYFDDGRLAGVVDFGLAHLDSRPYELAIARTYRSPETVDGYRAELARSGWPLTDSEEAAIEPMHRAFRVGMVAWAVMHGLPAGACDLAWVERQLERAAPR
jgi:homoserine kinase type II